MAVFSKTKIGKRNLAKEFMTFMFFIDLIHSFILCQHTGILGHLNSLWDREVEYLSPGGVQNI